MFRRVLLLFVVLALLLVGYEWLTFPDVARLAKEMPKSTAFMDLRRAQLRAEGKDDELLYTPVPYDRISPYLRRAVLVAEDNSFYEHAGVDTEAVREAIQRDLKRGKLTHGGSTITQQLAKNLYLSPSRNPLRKAKEYFIARSLETHLTKKRILELYLNVVEMGERIYGAEAASRFYFHTPASGLSPQQASLLAGCLPNPRLMVPGAPNKRLRSRQRMILSRLRRWGYLFEREVLTEKKPEESAAPAVDTALAQAPESVPVTPDPDLTDTASSATPATETTATATGTAPAPAEPPTSPGEPPATETAPPPP